MDWYNTIKAALRCPECGNKTLEKTKEFPPKGNRRTHIAVFKCTTESCKNEEVFN